MIKIVVLKMTAGDSHILDKVALQIRETVESKGGKCVGPIPLPMTRISAAKPEPLHRRGLDIINPDVEIVNALVRLNIPSGVKLDVRIKEREVAEVS